jgi:hypothetical protein
MHSNKGTDGGAEENIRKGRQGRDVPRTAAWGKLMIGVPYNDPNTPPFELWSETSVIAIQRNQMQKRLTS